jgi:outer membrane protein
MNKIVLIALALLMYTATTGYAQKFGYCNSEKLLAEMPDIKAADSDLQAFQTQLTKRGQERVKALQATAAEVKRKQDAGEISPLDLEKANAQLAEEEQAIAKYEQEVYDKLGKKREELFKPLLDRVNNAMKAVATKNGYTFVFDSSTNVLIYSDESLDVTKLVKAELGIN